MSHKDSGWRPHLGVQSYNGNEMWDHVGGPHEFNDAEVDGEIDLETEDAEERDEGSADDDV
jgi:hypothetical protein